MNIMLKKLSIAFLLPMTGVASAMAEDVASTLEFKAELTTSAGVGDFAPYYFTANRHGVLTQSANLLFLADALKPLDLSKRFDWGAGASFGAGSNEATIYERYTPDGWIENDRHASKAFLQQLYAEVKHRGVFLTIGMKQHSSAMLNNRLSSGDLTESGNARPNPEARIGFVDFQNIPFTNGWVQIQGELSYGPMIDYSWIKDHFNYYNGHITDGSIRNYKRCYFRTNPSQPLSVTVGAQCATIFGGHMTNYRQGEMTEQRHFSKSLKSFIEAFLPVSEGAEDFRLGNTLGSWDLMARYDAAQAGTFKAYFQWPWEDGSGIGRRNGFDGLWGLEYQSAQKGWLTGIVAEYLDFTNQSGPLHWAPGDRPNTTITGQATGSDDYYNNAYYNAYANYGLSIGTPFLKAPLFNTDGYMAYASTRLRGFHLAFCGQPTERLSYRAMVSYRKAWGNGWTPVAHPTHDTSVMLEACYSVAQLKGLSFKAAFGLDRGTLLGNNSGGELTISYNFGIGGGK